MTCTTTIADSLRHREAQVAALQARYVATLCEADGADLLGDRPRYEALRALGRRQYDIYERERDAWERAELDAKYPLTEG